MNGICDLFSIFVCIYFVLRRLKINQIIKLKHSIIVLPKRYFFNSIQPTKLTNQHVAIFKASMTNVIVITSILWGIESNKRKFEAELA